MYDVPILLIVLILLAILLRLDFIFYLAYVGVGVYALARWWTARSLPRLRVTRHMDEHAFLDQAIRVRVDIENTGWWPLPWLRFDDSLPNHLTILSTDQPLRQVVSLGPKERIELAYEVAGQRRGYYELGPARVRTGDFFGFAEAQGEATGVQHLTVYPRVVPLAAIQIHSQAPYGTLKSRQTIFTDPARISGRRDYQPGDPLHDIDWKSSAHAAALQVKKYEPAVSLASVILLNLNPAEYSRQWLSQASEWAIVMAASLANYLIGERQAVGLASNGLDPLTNTQRWSIPPRSGRVHLMKLLEWLARVQLAEGTPFGDWLPTLGRQLAWGTTVIAVHPTGDEAICRTLHRLLRGGLNPVLMVTEPHYQFGAVRERAQRLGFSAFPVSDERDLQRWCV